MVYGTIVYYLEHTHTIFTSFHSLEVTKGMNESLFGSRTILYVIL